MHGAGPLPVASVSLFLTLFLPVPVDRCVGCGGSVHSGSCSGDVYVETRGGEAVSEHVGIGEHAFSQMQGDLDQQRLLGERPTADVELVRQIQSKER